MGDQLKAWVGQRLHEVLGMSNATVAEYLIKVTQQLPTKARVLDELREEVTVDAKMEIFVNQLWQRVRGLFIRTYTCTFFSFCFMDDVPNHHFNYSI